MNIEDVIKIAQSVVAEANALRLKHVPQFGAHVGYGCIFCQSQSEYETIDALVRAYGTIAQKTATGFTYLVPPISTEAGQLRILKVRTPDPTRTERGDADFSINDYETLKSNTRDKPGFKLITRPQNEMIEIVDPDFNVRVYFSYPPVEKHPGIREALASTKL